MARRTDVVTINPANRQAGIYTFEAPQPVPVDVTQAVFTLTVDIADKLAVGKTVAWGFEFSADDGQTWTLGNRGTWQSYGPDGFTFTDLNGNVVTNPDPQIIVGLSARTGHRFRGTLTLSDALRTGVVIAIL